MIWRACTKLAVSGEWLGRTGEEEPGSRLVGVAEYEITDSIFLYASFGRDFEEAGARRNLVSTIGLSFGLGGGRSSGNEVDLDGNGRRPRRSEGADERSLPWCVRRR